jgi:hypothetical protein
MKNTYKAVEFSEPGVLRVVERPAERELERGEFWLEQAG